MFSDFDIAKTMKGCQEDEASANDLYPSINPGVRGTVLTKQDSFEHVSVSIVSSLLC